MDLALLIDLYKRDRRGGFLANFACPPYSKSPLKFKSASLFLDCQLDNQFRCNWKIKKWRRFFNTITHWSMPVRQFLRSLQTCGDFIPAFISEKQWMTIKKSFFHNWPLMLNFFIVVRCKTKGAVSLVCPLLCIWPLSA
jgi:hypothetical protein